MPAGWYELDRIYASPGSCARDAVNWWVGERFGIRRKWEWAEILVGSFRIDGELQLHAIRLGGMETDAWVFLRFDKGDSSCVT